MAPLIDGNKVVTFNAHLIGAQFGLHRANANSLCSHSDGDRSTGRCRLNRLCYHRHRLVIYDPHLPLTILPPPGSHRQSIADRCLYADTAQEFVSHYKFSWPLVVNAGPPPPPALPRSVLYPTTRLKCIVRSAQGLAELSPY